MTTSQTATNVHTDSSITTIPPKPDQVDSDEWMNKIMMMTPTPTKMTESGSYVDPYYILLSIIDDLDHSIIHLLSKFQAFVNQTSGGEGIVSHHPSTNTSTNNTTKEEILPATIRPRVFLNILHAVLKGDELNIELST